MEDKSKVSILVPVYGVEKYIERCARSLFEQTYDNIEYIFVDDCTKDKSIEILQKVLEEYPQRKEQVRIIHHKTNRGLSAARNTALDASTGDYLLHVDSDDYVSTDLLKLCMKYIVKNKSDAVVYSFYKIYADKRIRVNQPDSVTIDDFQQGIVSGHYCHTLWSGLVKKEIYKVNNIRSIEGLHQGEDYAVMTKLLLSTKNISIINTPLYYYVMRNNILNFKEKNIEDTVVACREIESFLKEKNMYELYKTSLHIYVQLMLCWLLNTCSTTKEYEYIQKSVEKLFIGKSITKGLALRYKIAIKLFNMRYYFFLRKYFFLFNYAQRIMGRIGKKIK